MTDAICGLKVVALLDSPRLIANISGGEAMLGMDLIWKRVGAGLGVLVLLTACGSAGVSPTGTPGDVAPDPGDATSEPVAEEITLEVASWVWAEPRGEEVAAVWIEAFESEHPNITIELVTVPYANYDNTIAAQLGTTAAPDVIQMSDVGFAQAVAAGRLTDLDPLIDYASLEDRLLPQNEFGVRDGTRYGYIYSMAMFGMFYNQELLDEADVELPTTFDDFLEASIALTDESAGQYGFAQRSTMAEAAGWFPMFSMWVLGNGAQYVSGDEVTIDTPEMKRAVEQYMTMYESGAMLTGTDAGTFRRLFADGGVGFTFDNGLGTQMNSFPQMEGRAYIAPTPFEGGNQLGLPLYIAISEDSPTKEAAAMLVEFFLSEEVQAGMSVALQGELPATFDWDNPPEQYQALIDDSYWIGPLESQVENAQPAIAPGPLSVLAPQIANAILTELSAVQAGEQSIDDMLRNAQEAVEAAAADSGL